MALEKAQKVFVNLNNKDKKPVLGSDTIVLINQQIMGKPNDTEHAKQILNQLSNSQHEVITAVAVVNENDSKIAINISRVKFKNLTIDDIESYIQTGEPFDKAGGYAIQGRAAVFIEYIEGSYSGIMGLPLFETANLLQSFNLK
jgi:septum formation protein